MEICKVSNASRRLPSWVPSREQYQAERGARLYPEMPSLCPVGLRSFGTEGKVDCEARVFASAGLREADAEELRSALRQAATTASAQLGISDL